MIELRENLTKFHKYRAYRKARMTSAFLLQFKLRRWVRKSHTRETETIYGDIKKTVLDSLERNLERYRFVGSISACLIKPKVFREAYRIVSIFLSI